MNNGWDELDRLMRAGEHVVVVTIASIRGSAPREVGAKMLVTQRESIGTIGGGQLEHECTRLAVKQLGSEQAAFLRKFSLGSAMGQCCGGVVEVLFEPIAVNARAWVAPLLARKHARQAATLVTRMGSTPAKFVVDLGLHRAPAGLPEEIWKRARGLLNEEARAERLGDYFLEPIVDTSFHLAVFGAGHVGTAVVHAFAAVECNIRWIDSRPNMFGQAPVRVDAIEARDPAAQVAAMPPGSYYLVMTHSHALDFEICDRILRRGDAAYCGLIGSLSKRRRFEKRYKAQGMSEYLLDSLICPIGIPGISSKKPAELALAVAAELLQVRERALSIRMGELAGSAQPVRR